MIPKSVRRKMHRHMRDFIEQNSHGDTCIDNAQVRAILDRCTVNGKIGVILDGMDCDCTKYHQEYIADAPTSVIEFKRYWNEHCDWLDGPETQRFVRPEVIDRSLNYSRDLALEAYEDGHPHVVYA